MKTPRGSLRNKYIAISAFGLVLYLLLSSGFNKLNNSGVIVKSQSEDVWLFLSDFNQLKTINPNILDFSITADHGNRDHWQYSVHFTEQMYHWPHWRNRVQAHISVKTIGSSTYLIESNQSTCFLGGLYCLYSGSETQLTQSEEGTNYKETVRFQCPPFLKFFCKREVVHQREIMYSNLRHHFHNLAHG